jgi:hypothetical protein
MKLIACSVPLWFSIRCGLVIARGTAIRTEPVLELGQN